MRSALSCLLVLAAATAPAAAGVDVGVSIGIAQPGVYGRIDIGRFPDPQLVLPTPILVTPRPVPAQPVYLWVPPGHQKHWSKHCARYQACGVPVYFVQDGWYQQHVSHGGPPGQDKRGGGHGKGNGNGR